MDDIPSGGAKRRRDEDGTEYNQELHDNNVLDDIPSGGAKRRRDEDEAEYIQELHDNNVVDDVPSCSAKLTTATAVSHVSYHMVVKYAVTYP